MFKFLNNVFLCLKIVFFLHKQGRPDEMSQSVGFHLGLHCLPKYRQWGLQPSSIIIWISDPSEIVGTYKKFKTTGSALMSLYNHTTVRSLNLKIFYEIQSGQKRPFFNNIKECYVAHVKDDNLY